MDPDDSGRLGRYDLIAALPHEDWGNVYLAAKLAPVGFNKLAVIRELRPELAADPAFVSRFLDDARVGTWLNHANIIETQEVGEDRGRPFVAMEYVEGQTLERVVDRVGPAEFPRAMWLRVVTDVLSGLHHAHEALDEAGAPLHLAHLRLSPRRVLITYDGQVKVLDFGRPEARDALESPSSPGRAAAYVAPEQARGAEPTDRRTDLFAVGVMLWEASTRKPMWGELDDRAILAEISGGRIPSLRQIDPEVPKPLADIVGRALAAAPDDRYSTAMHMQTDLEGFIRASGDVPTSRDIGRVVAQAFLDERLRATTVIDEQLRRLRARAFSSGTNETVSLLRLEAAHPISGPRSSSDPLRTSPTSPRAFPPGTFGSRGPRGPGETSAGSPGRIVLIGALAALIAAVVLIVLALRDAPSTANPAAAPGSAAPSAP